MQDETRHEGDKTGGLFAVSAADLWMRSKAGIRKSIRPKRRVLYGCAGVCVCVPTTCFKRQRPLPGVRTKTRTAVPRVAGGGWWVQPGLTQNFKLLSWAIVYTAVVPPKSEHAKLPTCLVVSRALLESLPVTLSSRTPYLVSLDYLHVVSVASERPVACITLSHTYTYCRSLPSKKKRG